MNLEETADITCPFCWERQTLLLDLSVPGQDYIEDCQVCCQPMRIVYSCTAGELTQLSTERAN